MVPLPWKIRHHDAWSMTKSSTPCRRAFRFGCSAGTPQNGQAVVLLVVPLGLAYLVRLPRFLSGSVTTTTYLDQQLSHPLNCLVIFDVCRQSGVDTCLTTSLSACFAQRVTDAPVHDEIAFRCFR